jgi:ABC-type amino acid transport substrate-binding protein
MRTTRVLVAIVLIAGLVAACGDDSGGEASSGGPNPSADDLGTIDRGVIRVAIRGDLPFAAEEDGELTGVDGDIMRMLAETLGQELRIETMDFSGQLGAIESGRVDVAIGSIGWQPERADAGLFTDAAYYAGATVVQQEDSNLSTLEDLEGKTIGTVTGYAQVPAIEEIPGAELQTYETADAVYLDVGTGRLDAAFVDTLQDIYTAEVRDDLQVETIPLEVSPEQIASDPAYAVFDKLQFPFYLPKSHEKLEGALSEALREMYASGELEKVMTKWNLDPQLFLTPGPSTTDRIGVDRPEGWEPPSIGSEE